MSRRRINIFFYKNDKPFKGFISTWTSSYGFSNKDFKQIAKQLKENHAFTNLQYVKRKFCTTNMISVSFSNEADEAAFIMLTIDGYDVEIEYD